MYLQGSNHLTRHILLWMIGCQSAISTLQQINKEVQ